MVFRFFLLSLVAASLSFAEETGPTPGAGVTISLNGVRNSTGQVVVAVYTKNDGFPTKGWVKIVRVPAQKGKTSALIDVPAGRYAVSAYHDENTDGKMNSGLLGPTEGFAFGNDARDTFGPPDFERCFMELKAEHPVELKTRY